MVKEIEVTSWDELMNTIHSLNYVSYSKYEGGHYRSPYVFRGMDVAKWGLLTSLQRLPKNANTRIPLIEKSLLRSFRKFAKDGTFDKQSEWYILAVAQHNGLPTRCLDWTSSPLVATHFACGNEEYKDEDGVIWCLHAGMLRDINESKNKKATSLKEIAWVYDTNLLEKSFNKLQTLDDSHEDGELLLMWEPPSLDSRIANQSGLLTILNSLNNTQDSFLKQHAIKYPDLIHKIILKASMKSHARDMLDQNNISERTLFPGLPGLCNWLKRYYGTAW